MRIVAAHLHSYALPLRRPWVAARAVLHERRGMLLSLIGDDGLTGWGDCAPLPSAGNAAQILAALTALAQELPGRDHAAVRALEVSVPEVRWALETALFDLAARQRGVPLAVHLGAQNFTGKVEVNAALGALDAHTAQRAVAALAQGYAIAKIKVGVGGVADELTLLHEIHAATAGRLRLRLDANRAWDESDAQLFLRAISSLPIDAVEEPLAQPTLEQLRALQQSLPYAIAVDESLPQFGSAALLAAGAVRRLVIKPARIGGIIASRDLAARAQDAGMEVVLTSVVDSAVGVAAAAHLAAAVAPELAHGFATLDWLARDVTIPPAICDGKLILNTAPGLGLTPVP
ncbi:o-succinylbenzoate synthase [Sulfurivermis fontis]|uniref:o-succinylbenzoate synthase n=1 Tax=Sulfurivermis fontis TaxID=1972068 RepID=UPI000FD92EAE|nr:o-succinylbenzoate synthase [Sulfurivermis fontis]